MQLIKNFLKGFALVSGFILALLISLSINSNTGLFASLATLSFSVATLFKSMPKLWISSRITSIALLTVALIACAASFGTLEKEENKRLQALRSNDAHAYLNEIKSIKGNDFFVAEAKQLIRASDPPAYLAAIKGKTDPETFLAELKVLDPPSYQAEMDRLAAEEKAKQDAKEAADRAELADLKAQVEQTPTFAEIKRLWLYTRIVELDPSNAMYKKERDRLRSIVQAQEEKANAERMKAEKLTKARSSPEDFLELVNFSWSKEGFGNVMEATFVLKNNAPIDIKDITILCQHSAASGTLIDSNTRTIYDVVKANGTRTFRNVNMGFIHTQASRSGCRITDANPM